MNLETTSPRPPNLPRRIADELRAELGCRYKAGHKLPGMHLLRKRFGVSINTIGAALDMLAGEGLVEKRRGSGVYVSEDAGRKRVGVLSELDLLDPRIGFHFRALAGALTLKLEELDIEPRLYVGHAEPGAGASDEPTCPGFWSDVNAGRLDGAVILNVPSTHAWNRRVSTMPLPAVGHPTEYVSDLDEDGMLDAALACLVGQGCRSIGLMSWMGKNLFRKKLDVLGLSSHDSWIRCDMDPAVRGSGWKEFNDIWGAPEGRPDGLVILDDMLFSDAQLAIMETGVRVPQDLKIVVQTSRNASPTIRLPASIIEVDPAEAAEILAGMISKRLRGIIPEPKRRLLSFRLITSAMPSTGKGTKVA